MPRTGRHLFAGRRRRAGRIAAVVTLALVSAAPAWGVGPVYQWVDEKGVTHFGDGPPPGQVPSQVVPLEPTSPGPNAAAGGAEDPYSILNQARRMEERRLAAERAQAEADLMRQQADREAAEARRIREEAQAPAPAPEATRYVPLYAPGYWRPYRPRYHGPRPTPYEPPVAPRPSQGARFPGR